MLFVSVLSAVISLDETKFNELQRPTFIKFFAPWCGHCKALAPKFEKMSDEFDEVDFAEIDCTQFNSVCSGQHIQGFPTLKLFLNGTFLKYEGSREQGDMQTWIHAMFQPLLQYTTVEQLQEQAAKYHKSSYFVLRTNSIERYEKLYAPLKGKLIIGAIKGNDELIAYREGNEVRFNGKLEDVDDVTKFVSKNQISLFTYITPGNFGQLIRGGPVLFLYGQKDALGAQIAELERIARSTILPYNPGFLVADSASESFIKEFGVEPNNSALCMINFVNDKMRKFVYTKYDPSADIEAQMVGMYEQFLAEDAQHDAEAAKEIATKKLKMANSHSLGKQELLEQIIVLFKTNTLVQVVATAAATAFAILIFILACTGSKPAKKPQKTTEESKAEEKKKQD